MAFSASGGKKRLTAELPLDLNAEAMLRGTVTVACVTHVDSNDDTLATFHAMNFAFDGKKVEIYPTWRENLTPSAR